MADDRRLRECERFFENFKSVNDRINYEERELLRAEEAVALTEGEISVETNILERIADQIADNADSGIGCALGDKRDCIAFVIGLTREQARHEGEIQQLRDKLRRQTAERDGIARAIADYQQELRRVEAAMDANRCSEFSPY